MAEGNDYFTVDTHLFRELGELLVGRDSTALVELIKNSYDADASEVLVYGEHLEDPARGRIVIADNGTGMTPERFRTSFLRVASRMKDGGDRRSALHRRRYTGAKGIGRLAAHKLACQIEVKSTPHVAISPHGSRESVSARIDWDLVEQLETLDQVAGSGAVEVNSTPAPSDAKSGTVLTLTRLRRKWTPTERARFFAEVQSFSPPSFFTKELSRKTVAKPLLFAEPMVRLSDDTGRAFSVRLEGEFDAGEEYWRLLELQAAWVIEISCRPEDSVVKYEIAPTRKTEKKYPDARRFSISVPHPDPINGPFFDARIFVRVGALRGKTDHRAWASSASGVRVYMEGFRVLPYGEPSNDWLRLDSDYTRRSRTLETLERWGIEDTVPGDDKDAALTRWPNNNFFGAVFLVHEHAKTLRSLVNREGFVPEAGFDRLVDLVRTGVDLCTRTHAAATQVSREERRTDRQDRQREKSMSKGGTTRGTKTAASRRKETLDATSETLSKAREQLIATAADPEEAADLVKEIGDTLDAVHDLVENEVETISERSLLRVLATVGTQMSGFVHEIRSLLAGTMAVERALSDIQRNGGLSPAQQRRIGKVLQAVGELRRGLEREASYLTDIVSPDARRRRSRQLLSERFDAASRLVEHSASRRSVRVENAIPQSLKSPPMFPAELMAVFTNLLTNAVKGAGAGGYVYASGELVDRGKCRILIQNTGRAVDLEIAEQWFRPFESTTELVDPVLGQGMGLGLPITRRLLEDYDAVVRFVEPEQDFSTAVEIMFES